MDGLIINQSETELDQALNKALDDMDIPETDQGAEQETGEEESTAETEDDEPAPPPKKSKSKKPAPKKRKRDEKDDKVEGEPKAKKTKTEGEETKKKKKKPSPNSFDSFKKDLLNLYKQNNPYSTDRSIFSLPLTFILFLLRQMELSNYKLVETHTKTLMKHLAKREYELNTTNEAEGYISNFNKFYEFVVNRWVERYKKEGILNVLEFQQWDYTIQEYALGQIRPCITQGEMTRLGSLRTIPFGDKQIGEFKRLLGKTPGLSSIALHIDQEGIVNSV